MRAGGVALKIQRRRYTRAAVFEVFIHIHIRERTGANRDIVGLHEAFLDDGHICMAFERHGRSLAEVLDRGPLPPDRVVRVTRQLLGALDRMHRCGYAHTDVKPGNILYSPRTGEARLADLGCADNRFHQGSQPGTREYTAPELILGAPQGASLDLWGLGCTVFEMLTGRLLFSPRKVAAKKYREFSHGADAVEVPLAPSERQDRLVERAEQFKRGDLIAGKYRLDRRLGSGRYATVWSATRISDRKLDGSYDTLWGYAQRQSDGAATKTERERLDREWRKAKGADDLLDLALNYEHLLLIAAICGPFPPGVIDGARYRDSYFESAGGFRFEPKIGRDTLRERLRRIGGLRGRSLDGATEFLRGLLQLDPARRASAADSLKSPWLASTTPAL
ncbi:MAG: protein kinase [Chthoniobacteraceae bacterium]